MFILYMSIILKVLFYYDIHIISNIRLKVIEYVQSNLKKNARKFLGS